MSEPMKAVRFHGPRDLRLEMVPRPGPVGPDQVKVRIEAAGICGSDLHVYSTGAWVKQPPMIMGHELAGTIIEVGSEVSGLHPGEQVVADSRVACGQCDQCRRLRPNLCRDLGFLGEVQPGAYAEEIVLPAAGLIGISADVPIQAAVLAEPLAVAIHALRQAVVEDSSRVLILGAGPIGALILETACLEGWSQVTCLELSPYRRRAIQAVHPEVIRDAPGGPYDLVFETTGSTVVAGELVPKVMNKRGTLVMVGLFERPVPFDFNHVVENEWRIRGCSAFESELEEAVVMLEKHWPKLGWVVSHRWPLEKYQEAFELLTSPEKKALKVVLQP
ncbi:MAG: alcohol dehydrogenase catalytic domain-containing protein [Thermodesulfobacteriota bacterium]